MSDDLNIDFSLLPFGNDFRRKIKINTEFIKLDSFMKFAGFTTTAGQAKAFILGGSVSVNGMPETRRGRKIYPGDVVSFGDITIFAESDSQS